MLIPEEWGKDALLLQIIVARRSPGGEFGVGVFLVDLGLLGVKDAYQRVLLPSQYEDMKARISAEQPLVSASLDLAAKIIREGIAYARRYGFNPHPDYARTALVLEGANPDDCAVPIPLGEDGKPFYVAGPYDNAPKTIRQLEQTAGPGNYHFLVLLPELPTELPGDPAFRMREEDDEHGEGERGPG